MSTSREHLAENIDVFDFTLSQPEHDRVTRPSYLRTGRTLFEGLVRPRLALTARR